ncbi:unnamed protein product, partial [Ectocarpus sp. 8 AP-2014]
FRRARNSQKVRAQVSKPPSVEAKRDVSLMAPCLRLTTLQPPCLVIQGRRARPTRSSRR